MRVVSVNFTDKILLRKRRSAILFTSIMLLASYSAIEFGSWEALATSDDDGDGLTYGLEFIINTQPPRLLGKYAITFLASILQLQHDEIWRGIEKIFKSLQSD